MRNAQARKVRISVAPPGTRQSADPVWSAEREHWAELPIFPFLAAQKFHWEPVSVGNRHRSCEQRKHILLLFEGIEYTYFIYIIR